MSREVVKSLLFYSERESHRVRNGCRLQTVPAGRLHLAHVRNDNPGGHAIVGVEALALRPGTGCAHGPARRHLQIHSEPGLQGLRNGPLIALDTPCPEVLRDRRYAKVVSKSAFQSRVGGSRVILVNGRPKQNVASFIACKKSGFAPRTSQAKFNSAREIPRMQVLFRERAGFAHHTSRERKPVSNRAARHIYKLTKQILVHVHGIKCVATQRKLQTRRNLETYVSKAQHRVHVEIENGIERVSFEN